tara:strand:- start:3111 stop:3254 length:144 start_codon:yes stop_codon:yes gene_type:complete
MATPTLYKKIATNEVSLRNQSNVNSTELAEANTILQKFVTLFKAEHL